MASRDIRLELEPHVSIAPQSVGGAVNGTGVDTTPGEAVYILLDSGAATTPATVKIQESVDNSTFTDVADTDLIGVTGNSSGVAQTASTIAEVSYIGTKRYVRVVTTAGTAALFSAEVILAHLRHAGGVPV